MACIRRQSCPMATPDCIYPFSCNCPLHTIAVSLLFGLVACNAEERIAINTPHGRCRMDACQRKCHLWSYLAQCDCEQSEAWEARNHLVCICIIYEQLNSILINSNYSNTHTHGHTLLNNKGTIRTHTLLSVLPTLDDMMRVSGDCCTIATMSSPPSGTGESQRKKFV